MSTGQIREPSYSAGRWSRRIRCRRLHQSRAVQTVSFSHVSSHCFLLLPPSRHSRVQVRSDARWLMKWGESSGPPSGLGRIMDTIHRLALLRRHRLSIRKDRLFGSGLPQSLLVLQGSMMRLLVQHISRIQGRSVEEDGNAHRFCNMGGTDSHGVSASHHLPRSMRTRAQVPTT